MVYRVRLINVEHSNCPYEVGGIVAENEKIAGDKAKDQIVKGGYWFPWEDNIQQRYKKLKVESVTIDD